MPLQTPQKPANAQSFDALLAGSDTDPATALSLIEQLPAADRVEAALALWNSMSREELANGEPALKVAFANVSNLPERMQYQAAQTIASCTVDNKLKNDAVKTAFAAISHLSKTSRFQAALRLSHLATENGSLLTDIFETALDAIENLPQQKQREAAHKLNLAVPEDSRIKAKVRQYWVSKLQGR